MARIDKLWVPEGHLLGLRMSLDGQTRVAWWRVTGRNLAHYEHAFAATLTNTATGWTEIQQAATLVDVLEPREQRVINHAFVGVSPSDALLYLQYPLNTDQWAVTGNRLVDGNGIGAMRAVQSPFLDPDPLTELFVVSDSQPAFNVFNASGFTQTPRLYLYIMQYAVEGPFLASDPEVGGERRAMELVDQGQARMATIYGIKPITMPKWAADSLRQKLQAQGRAA